MSLDQPGEKIGRSCIAVAIETDFRVGLERHGRLAIHEIDLGSRCSAGRPMP